MRAAPGGPARERPLRDVLAERGIHPSRRLGQNFMIDPNMLDFIIRTAAVEPGDLVVEIGPGTGFLTGRLVEKARHVIAVEIDGRLADVCRERLGRCENLTIIECDAIRRGEWNPLLVRALDEALDTRRFSRLTLVANLPYSIATAVVTAALLGPFFFDGCFFTCQWEVAERLTAREGSREYGYISVMTRLLCEARVLRRLPPSVFWPQPKIDSAIVEMRPHPDEGASRSTPADISAVVSLLMMSRRKRLMKVLKALKLDSEVILKVEQTLRGNGLEKDERIFRLPAGVLREISEIISAK